MNVGNRVTSDHQLVRLLQIGIVLEEVVEARASNHYQSLATGNEFEPDPAVTALLTDANEESAEHRERLEELITQLDAETIPFNRIQQLVTQRYSQTKPEDFDDILYDQLHGEESAYKFYDDLITAIENSDTAFSIDRDRLIATLTEIREEEAEGVEEVTAVMSEDQ
jgi:rubrerythrin